MIDPSEISLRYVAVPSPLVEAYTRAGGVPYDEPGCRHMSERSVGPLVAIGFLHVTWSPPEGGNFVLVLPQDHERTLEEYEDLRPVFAREVELAWQSELAKV